MVDFSEQSTEGSSTLVAPPAQPEILSSTDIIPENFTAPAPGSMNVDNESVASPKASVSDLFAGINESFSASIDEGENARRSSRDTVTSFVDSVVKNATKSVDNVFSKVYSAVDQTGELANKKITGISCEISGATSKVPAVVVDVLRRTIIEVESSLASGASYAVYLYGSAKEQLPAEIRDTLDVYEGKATEILKPIGSASQQVYMAFYSLEKNLGLDPNDPIVPIVVLVGSSATLWAVYWFLTNGGYSGDLTPKSAFDLLAEDKDAALIDIRSEVDGSLRKLLKGGVDDSLVAAVIRNLKIVKDRSKVIVLDADSTRSKGIARSLRKIGIKNAYMIQGGSQSWMKQGLCIKELKPETALTILNEEAEAILEDVRPSLLQLLGYGTEFRPTRTIKTSTLEGPHYLARRLYSRRITT